MIIELLVLFVKEVKGCWELGVIAETEGGDAPMGKNSSDEEDLSVVLDDDEYDTEDSFIDDAELDDYFQVDNSAIKHDEFFVNHGKSERMLVFE
ncbi:hypothetical protein HanOQP8_Chr01g0017461 [Helianthus annuus]|nr:hypothetical protein HanOQP8_Chr01g0017461 [Helianthus annuus]